MNFRIAFGLRFIGIRPLKSLIFQCTNKNFGNWLQLIFTLKNGFELQMIIWATRLWTLLTVLLMRWVLCWPDCWVDFCTQFSNLSFSRDLFFHVNWFYFCRVCACYRKSSENYYLESYIVNCADYVLFFVLNLINLVWVCFSIFILFLYLIFLPTLAKFCNVLL